MVDRSSLNRMLVVAGDEKMENRVPPVNSLKRGHGLESSYGDDASDVNPDRPAATLYRMGNRMEKISE